jgi:hypothetical protein
MCPVRRRLVENKALAETFEQSDCLSFAELDSLNRMNTQIRIGLFSVCRSKNSR